MAVAGGPSILRLDVSGRPQAWIPWQEAVCLYVRGQVAWEGGRHRFRFHGGRARWSGRRSVVEVSSIIAVHGRVPASAWRTPHLSNRELFRRDRHMCLYCGETFPDRALTRDHVIPRAQGGDDRWTNVVTACRRCNVKKGARTPEEAGMPLLAVPFAPNPAEYLALLNRRILADQMDFLKQQFRHPRLMDLA